jgi:hypothetical protein
MITTNSIHVIASQRVGAKRRPMTGSAKQSISQLAQSWIASSQALLAMTGNILNVEVPDRPASRPVQNDDNR